MACPAPKNPSQCSSLLLSFNRFTYEAATCVRLEDYVFNLMTNKPRGVLTIISGGVGFLPSGSGKNFQTLK